MVVPVRLNVPNSRLLSLAYRRQAPPTPSTGGSVSDGDKGDITVSGSGATWSLDAGVVTTTELGGDITTAGKALLDDADAAAQRTTLGLGTAATQASGAFDAAGTAAAAIAAHEAAGDPHPTYLTAAEGAAAYLPIATTLDQVDAPVASVDIAGQQMLSMCIENRTSDPGSPAAGQIWLRTDL